MWLILNFVKVRRHGSHVGLEIISGKDNLINQAYSTNLFLMKANTTNNV